MMFLVKQRVAHRRGRGYRRLKIDAWCGRPALNYDNGQVIAKFTRVETFGAANTHWVAATIDPRDPNLFEFSPRIVPGNVNDR